MAKVTLEIAADVTGISQATDAVSDFGKAAVQAGDNQRKAFRAGSEASNAANKSILDLANNVSIAGVSVGDVTQRFTGFKKGVDIVSKAFGSLRAAIAATGIGALVIALTSLVTFFTKTERGAKLLERATAALGAAFDVLIGVVTKIGGAIVDAFKNPLGAIQKFGNAILHPIDTFTKLNDTIQETGRQMLLQAAAADEITKALQALEDQERDASLILSKNQTQIDKLLVQSKNRALSEKERLALLDQASKLEEQNLTTELANANQRISLIQRENALKEKNGTLLDEDKQKEVDAILKRDELERQSLVLQEKIINRREQLNIEFFDKFQERQKELNEKLQTISGIPVFDKAVKSGKEAVEVGLQLKGTLQAVQSTDQAVALSFGESFTFLFEQLSDFNKKYASFIDDFSKGLTLLGQLQNTETQNRIGDIESETQIKLDAIDLEIEARKKAGREFEDLEIKKRKIQSDSDSQTKKLQKEQFERNKKYQKANAIINGAQSILKTYAEYGFTPLGIAAALLDAAVVALEIANIDKQEFWKGGYTGDGGKYDEAGTVHKGEFVSKQETTKKHRNLLEALHKDDYSELTSADLAPILRGTGVVLKEDVPVRINSTYDAIRTNSSGDPYIRLSSMEKKMENFFKYYKTQPKESYEKDGTKVVKMGNTTRRIKKKG